MFKSFTDKAKTLAGDLNKKKETPPAAQGEASPPAAGEASGTQPAAQKEDYLDKAVGAGAKKYGIKTDAKTNEAITDGARGFFEKVTGKKVPPKVSN